MRTSSLLVCIFGLFWKSSRATNPEEVTGVAKFAHATRDSEYVLGGGEGSLSRPSQTLVHHYDSRRPSKFSEPYLTHLLIFYLQRGVLV